MAEKERFVAYINANNAITVPDVIRKAMDLSVGSFVAITIEKRD